MGQINEFFDVTTLLDYNMDSRELKSIPDDIDTLLVLQPLNLSDQALYTIDQFVLGGGIFYLHLTQALLLRLAFNTIKKWITY